MKAVLVRALGKPDTHRIEAVPPPVCTAGEVLIEVHAAAVNFPDLLLISGQYQKIPPLPFTPGTDAAGIVRAVGQGVDRVVVGDRVLVHLDHGAYATHALAPAAWVHRLPDALPFADAAAMGLVYQTAYFALTQRAHVRPGDRVLVTGAGGGVGLAAVQIAKSLGAIVLAGVSRLGQSEAVRESGADHVIELSGERLRDTLRAQVLSATDGHGVDVVIDTVGGDVFDAALRALAWSGRLVVVGFAGGRIPEVKANYLLLKNIAVCGLQWTDYRAREPQRVDQAQRHLFDLYTSGALKPRISRRLPLSRFAEAMALVRDGAKIGKVVLDTQSTEEEIIDA